MRQMGLPPSMKSMGFPREAMFYECLEKNKVRCLLCPRKCVINDGERGFCTNRENREGRLYAIGYGNPSVVDIGPIEKAPLYHFLPGHSRLCLTCAGCNLRCSHCQNWHLSQTSPEEKESRPASPEAIVEEARRRKLFSISFTYTEPTVYYEYVYDISAMAKENGMKTSIVSNGYIRQEPLLKLLKLLDAVKIDLKGYGNAFYPEMCSGTLGPVLESLETVRAEGVWLEVVNLVIPSLNDDPKLIGEMCRWITENLGRDTPLHFTRFFPSYRRTDLPPTPVATLERAHAIAKEAGLNYVYVGNVPGHAYNSTFCPSCKRRLIHRTHFDVVEMNLVNGRCRFCNHPIPGIWR